MGQEALSKVSRRDIRRAFSPEASAEVFRFVEHTEKALEDRCIGIERGFGVELERAANMLRGEVQTIEQAHDKRISDLSWALDHVMFKSTFRQRLIWLLRGTWL